MSSALRDRPLATVCHPASIVAPDVSIDVGAMLSASATVVTGTRIGRGCIVNTGCAETQSVSRRPENVQVLTIELKAGGRRLAT